MEDSLPAERQKFPFFILMPDRKNHSSGGCNYLMIWRFREGRQDGMSKS
jgi:hypothetical protein